MPAVAQGRGETAGDRGELVAGPVGEPDAAFEQPGVVFEPAGKQQGRGQHPEIAAAFGGRQRRRRGLPGGRAILRARRQAGRDGGQVEGGPRERQGIFLAGAAGDPLLGVAEGRVDAAERQLEAAVLHQPFLAEIFGLADRVEPGERKVGQNFFRFVQGERGQRDLDPAQRRPADQGGIAGAVRQREELAAFFPRRRQVVLLEAAQPVAARVVLALDLAGRREEGGRAGEELLAGGAAVPRVVDPADGEEPEGIVRRVGKVAPAPAGRAASRPIFCPPNKTMAAPGARSCHGFLSAVPPFVGRRPAPRPNGPSARPAASRRSSLKDSAARWCRRRAARRRGCRSAACLR